jgi:hypothetical protein
MGRGRYSTAMVVHRLARAGLLDVFAEPFTADEHHEPSAAERAAAASAVDLTPEGAEVALDEPAPLGANPFAPVDETPDEPTIDLDAELDRTAADDAGDDAWDAWSAGNPFEHPIPADEEELPVSFGPRLDSGLDLDGPEAAPDDALLPRRTAVREADRPTHAPSSDLGGGLAPGLAGITGFHDPTAEVASRNHDDALSAATGDPALDPNAAWLENLYAQFIDDPEEAPTGKNKKKVEALDVAFQAPEQADTEKVGTLKRLAAALRRL